MNSKDQSEKMVVVKKKKKKKHERVSRQILNAQKPNVVKKTWKSSGSNLRHQIA